MLDPPCSLRVRKDFSLALFHSPRIVNKSPRIVNKLILREPGLRGVGFTPPFRCRLGEKAGLRLPAQWWCFARNPNGHLLVTNGDAVHPDPTPQQ